MNRTLKTVLIVLGVLLLVYVWGTCQYRQGAEEQRLLDEGRIADSVARATDVLRKQMAQQDSVRAIQLRRQGETIRQLRARQPVIRVVTDSTPRDSLLLAVAQRDTVIESQKAIIATQDSSLSLYAAMVAARDSLIPRLVAERDAYRVQARAWQNQAQPSTLKRVGNALPWIAGAYLLGRLTK